MNGYVKCDDKRPSNLRQMHSLISYPANPLENEWDRAGIGEIPCEFVNPIFNEYKDIPYRLHSGRCATYAQSRLHWPFLTGNSNFVNLDIRHPGSRP